MKPSSTVLPAVVALLTLAACRGGGDEDEECDEDGRGDDHRDRAHRGSWKPPVRPASCPNVVDFGHGLAIGRSGKGHFVCAGDTTLDPSGRLLPYGKVSVEGAFMCTSTMFGMTCQRGPGAQGFLISRQSYRVF
jgi:hypothetical protein